MQRTESDASAVGEEKVQHAEDYNVSKHYYHYYYYYYYYYHCLLFCMLVKRYASSSCN
jgi:hypothetical protein